MQRWEKRRKKNRVREKSVCVWVSEWDDDDDDAKIGKAKQVLMSRDKWGGRLTKGCFFEQNGREERFHYDADEDKEDEDKKYVFGNVR